jgi:hypothetical protein
MHFISSPFRSMNKYVIGRWIMTAIQAFVLNYVYNTFLHNTILNTFGLNAHLVTSIRVALSIAVYYCVCMYVIQQNDLAKLMHHKLKIDKNPENPFVNPSWVIDNRLEIHRIAFAAITIAPFRLFFAMSWLLFQIFLATIVYIVFARNTVSAIMHGLFCFNFRMFLLSLGYYFIRVDGKFDPKTTFYLPNHVGIMDTFALASQHAFRGVGAQEYAFKIFAGLIKMTQTILVNREDHNSKKNTIEAIKMAAMSVRKDIIFNIDTLKILIFPQGTCSNGQYMVKFKQGAFIPGEPVQLIKLEFQKGCETMYHPSWVEFGPGFIYNFVRLLTEPVQFVHITYYPTYFPSIEEKNDAKLFMTNVEESMIQLSNIKRTNYSHSDVLIQKYCQKVLRNVNPLTISLETIQSIYPDANIDWVCRAIDEYKKINMKDTISSKDVKQEYKDYIIDLANSELSNKLNNKLALDLL